ncbi:MAG: DUF106 domain-containing protein [Candidatus Micrarchaeota archaeon]|nr:DUF106 domain-containing protein [Candidatus Micrarchaeota archaeon]
METIILVLALIYILANRYLAPFFYSREKLQQYRKEYFDTYKELLKEGPSADVEKIQERQQKLIEISKKQMKESMKAMLFTLALFFLLYTAIDFIYPVEYTEKPTGEICLAYNGTQAFIYENGTLKTIEFLPFVEPKVVNVTVEKYDCNEAVVYLPFPIGNIQYVYGYKRIFILYVMLLSILWALGEKIYKTFFTKNKNEGP